MLAPKGRWAWPGLAMPRQTGDAGAFNRRQKIMRTTWSPVRRHPNWAHCGARCCPESARSRWSLCQLRPPINSRRNLPARIGTRRTPRSRVRPDVLVPVYRRVGCEFPEPATLRSIAAKLIYPGRCPQGAPSRRAARWGGTRPTGGSGPARTSARRWGDPGYPPARVGAARPTPAREG